MNGLAWFFLILIAVAFTYDSVNIMRTFNVRDMAYDEWGSILFTLIIWSSVYACWRWL